MVSLSNHERSFDKLRVSRLRFALLNDLITLLVVEYKWRPRMPQVNREALTKKGFRIAEVECKSLLNKSGLADYAVNCYSGCEHGCRYCYARFVTRFSHPGEQWGSFVDIKVNAPAVLAREVKRKRVGKVFVSSVCDGWQPNEANYGLTRQCLEILLSYGYPVTILYQQFNQ